MRAGDKEGFAITAAGYLGMVIRRRPNEYTGGATEGGPLYIIFQKDNGPKSDDTGRSGQVAQLTHSCDQFKNPLDHEIVVASPALLYAMRQWIDHIPDIRKLYKRMRSRNKDLNDVQNIEGFPIEPNVSQDSEYTKLKWDKRYEAIDNTLLNHIDSALTIKVRSYDYYERETHDEFVYHFYDDDGYSSYEESLYSLKVRDAIGIAHTTGVPLDYEAVLAELSDFIEKEPDISSLDIVRAQQLPTTKEFIDNINDLTRRTISYTYGI